MAAWDPIVLSEMSSVHSAAGGFAEVEAATMALYSKTVASELEWGPFRRARRRPDEFGEPRDAACLLELAILFWFLLALGTGEEGGGNVQPGSLTACNLPVASSSIFATAGSRMLAQSARWQP